MKAFNFFQLYTSSSMKKRIQFSLLEKSNSSSLTKNYIEKLLAFVSPNRFSIKIYYMTNQIMCNISKTNLSKSCHHGHHLLNLKLHLGRFPECPDFNPESPDWGIPGVSGMKPGVSEFGELNTCHPHITCLPHHLPWAHASAKPYTTWEPPPLLSHFLTLSNSLSLLLAMEELSPLLHH